MTFLSFDHEVVQDGRSSISARCLSLSMVRKEGVTKHGASSYIGMPDKQSVDDKYSFQHSFINHKIS